MPTPTKLHRWLDLIAFLAGRRMPVTVDQVMRSVPAYAARWRTDDAKARASARRMFERDKEELRTAGIPIKTVHRGHGGGDADADAAGIEGYRLVRADLYLPYLKLVRGNDPTPPRALPHALEITEEEAGAAIDALRHLAKVPDFPFLPEARSAYRKLTFDLDPERIEGSAVVFARPSPDGNLRPLARILSDALLRRKRVGFRYRGIERNEATTRDVAPYGLFFQQSQWYLVGHDGLRGGLRVFRLSRIADPRVESRNPGEPDYEIPRDFDLMDYAGRRAWELGAEEESALPVRVLFRFPISLWAERNGIGEIVERRADGGAVRTLQVRDTAHLVRWITSLGGGAEVQLPAELRQECRALARRVAELHREGSHG